MWDADDVPAGVRQSDRTIGDGDERFGVDVSGTFNDSFDLVTWISQEHIRLQFDGPSRWGGLVAGSRPDSEIHRATCSPRVLLLEDHPGLRRSLARVLRTRVEVDEAERLHDALERIRTTNYDLAIADDGLPDGSGRILLEQLRETQAGCRRALISGNDVRLHTDEGVEVEFERFFLKPADLTALIEWVDVLCR